MRWVTVTIGCCLILCAGCGITPRSAVDWRTLANGDKLIYLEQGDRLPKEVMMLGRTNLQGRVLIAGMAPDIVAELIKQLLATSSEFAKAYAAERQNEGYVSRRILIRGYGTSELPDIVNVIKAFDHCIERWGD